MDESHHWKGFFTQLKFPIEEIKQVVEFLTQVVI
jgi:hypothetical protein